MEKPGKKARLTAGQKWLMCCLPASIDLLQKGNDVPMIHAMANRYSASRDMMLSSANGSLSESANELTCGASFANSRLHRTGN
jgi:hypothetical protein